ADPLAGAYAIEARTLDIEREARALIEKIDAIGGARQAIESGFGQKEIADSAYAAQKAIEEKRATVSGVHHAAEPGPRTPTRRCPPRPRRRSCYCCCPTTKKKSRTNRSSTTMTRDRTTRNCRCRHMRARF